jgi:hypothetical protein
MRVRVRERWKTVPGYPEYEASTDGRVRSWRKPGNSLKTPTSPGIMKPWIKKKAKESYKELAIGLFGDDGKQKQFTLASVILMTFVGPKPVGKVCRHLDDIYTNNRISNLCYGTVQDNTDDKTRNRRRKLAEESKAEESLRKSLRK